MRDLRCLPCGNGEKPGLSRRDAVRRVGNWVIYLGVLGGAAELAGCGPEPIVTVGNGAANSPTPTGPTPTPSGPTPTPTGTPDVCGCTATPTGVNTGLTRTSLAVNSVAYNSSKKVFLCHDSAGFYSLSSLCTHQGENMGTLSGGYSASNLGAGFYCNAHGSRFNANGSVTSSPANSALDHFQVAFDASENIWIDDTQVVGASCRCT